MKMDQLRDLSRQELQQKAHDTVEEIFNLRLRKRVQEINNPLQLRTLRRDLARIHTVLLEGERQAASSKEKS